MDAQRIADITAALSDLLGAGVTNTSGVKTPKLAWWDWKPRDPAEGYHWYSIFGDGDIAVTADNNGPIIDADDLDKLHAASQIVRRMNHA